MKMLLLLLIKVDEETYAQIEHIVDLPRYFQLIQTPMHAMHILSK